MSFGERYIKAINRIVDKKKTINFSRIRVDLNWISVTEIFNRNTNNICSMDEFLFHVETTPVPTEHRVGDYELVYQSHISYMDLENCFILALNTSSRSPIMTVLIQTKDFFVITDNYDSSSIRLANRIIMNRSHDIDTSWEKFI